MIANRLSAEPAKASVINKINDPRNKHFPVLTKSVNHQFS